MHDHHGFENFRRERNKRRMEGGPLRPMGQNAAILRELEEAENREVRNQQLTREVHEFFADATRTAATIVSQVAENAETQLQESVAHEMTEFLAETMRRVQQFVQLVQVSVPPGVAQKDIEANIQNIVGATLDEFRFAGDAATAEAHVGQDPFATEVDLSPRPKRDDEEFAADEVEEPSAEVARDDPQPERIPMPKLRDPDESLEADSDEGDVPSPIEDHLVAEVLGVPEEDVLGGGDPLVDWFERLREDDEAARNVLRLLVRSNFMTKAEARAIYKAR